MDWIAELEAVQLGMLKTLSITTQDLIDPDTTFQFGEEPDGATLEEIQVSLSRMSQSLSVYGYVRRREAEHRAV